MAYFLTVSAVLVVPVCVQWRIALQAHLVWYPPDQISKFLVSSSPSPESYFNDFESEIEDTSMIHCFFNLCMHIMLIHQCGCHENLKGTPPLGLGSSPAPKIREVHCTCKPIQQASLSELSAYWTIPAALTIIDLQHICIQHCPATSQSLTDGFSPVQPAAAPARCAPERSRPSQH